ncbi:hypothetical protein FRC03_002927 [Tulasnella sp. 419]|nr:hypothetical protein FRC03_002927 [Tulasnella sp. 419]
MVQLQDKIKFHEEALINLPTVIGGVSDIERRLRYLEFKTNAFKPCDSQPKVSITVKANKAESKPYKKRDNKKKISSPYKAWAHAIGWSQDLGPLPFAKDDSVISRGKTPEMVNARPCQHCGSLKHWDNNCRHTRKGAKQAKANFVNPSTECIAAQEEYEEAYLNADTDGEDGDNGDVDKGDEADEELKDGDQEADKNDAEDHLN